MKRVLRLSAALLFILLSCSKGGGSDEGSSTGGGGTGGSGSGGGTTTVDCTNVPKTFASNANPLIQTYCNQSGCHNTNSINGPGPLTNYSEIFVARAAIRDAVATGRMPQNTTLTTAQKNTIICWIDNGGPNN